MGANDSSEASLFINSSIIDMIKPSDHAFDMPKRAKQAQKKQSGTINTCNDFLRASDGIGKHHHSKIIILCILMYEVI